MRISDWSSDVCSSDLRQLAGFRHASHQPVCGPQVTFVDAGDADRGDAVAVEYLLGPDEIGLAEGRRRRQFHQVPRSVDKLARQLLARIAADLAAGRYRGVARDCEPVKGSPFPKHRTDRKSGG